MYCEFEASFKKHPNHSCAKHGSDVKKHKCVIWKWLHLEITVELLQE